MSLDVDEFGNSLDGGWLTDPLLPISEEDDDLEDPQIVSNLSGEMTALRSNRQADRKDLLKNARRVLALSWFSFTGRAVWSQSILSIFVYLLHPDKIQRVGYITAALGVSQVVSSLFTQRATKVYKHHQLLKLAALVGMVAIGLTFYAVLIKRDYFWVLGAVSTWGIMWGITDAVLPALFLRSVPEEDQTTYFTRGSRIIRSSNVLGPLLVMAVFLYLGNDWTLQNCAIVICAGLGFCIPMVILLCCLRDVGNIDEGGPPEEIHLEDVQVITDNNKSDYRNPFADNMVDSDRTDPIDSSDSAGGREDLVEGDGFWLDQWNVVPALIFTTEVMSAVASGLSVRYFPIFFMDNLSITPIQLQLLYMMSPLGQASTKWLAKALARFMGASVVAVVFSWAFVAILGSMVYTYQAGSSTWVICLLYLGHTFFMNSTSAIIEAIRLSSALDDQSSRWTVAESLQLLLWSFGSVAGGFLVGTSGILVCFWATVTLQLVASLPVCLLCCVGPKREVVNALLFPEDEESEEEFDGDDLNVIESFPRDERSLETRYEDTLEHLDSDSDSEFFDCSDGGGNNTVAIYRNNTCLYSSGERAFVPVGTSPRTLPPNYLKICKGNRKRALKMWKATQQWREDGEVWKIHTLPHPWYRRINEMYPHFLHGTSKEGYPVVYEQVGKMKLNQLFREGCKISDLTRWYTFFMEYLCVRFYEQHETLQYDHQRGQEWGFVVVMDMEGTGISMLSSNVLSYLAQASHINGSHYPLSLKHCFLVNAGSMVTRVWPALRAVLPSTAHYELFTSTSGIQDYIDADQIPPEYGGSSQYRLTQHPEELRLQALIQ